MSKARPRHSGAPAGNSGREKAAPVSASATAGRQRRLLPVCLLLAAVTLAVFWPVTGHDFVNYDDNLYVTDNAHVRRIDTGRHPVGVWRPARRQLAPRDVAFSHAGRNAVWDEARGASLDERAVP